MSILRFLRVIQGIQSQSSKPAPPRNRRLELEALERRAVLTVLEAPVPLPEPLEATAATTTVESAPLTDPPASSEETPPLDYGGSGSGTGGPGPGETPDPSTETLPTDGGSGGGTGEPPPDPPPPIGGSGSGTGTGEAPTISSLGTVSDPMWVWFVGTVTDADGPVEGLTVYFMIGEETTVSFTATVQADGSFRSLDMILAQGTEIYAYTIDAQGNQSTLVTCTV